VARSTAHGNSGPAATRQVRLRLSASGASAQLSHAGGTYFVGSAVMRHGSRVLRSGPRFWLSRATRKWRRVPPVFFVAVVAAGLMAVIAFHDPGSSARHSVAGSRYSPAVQRYFAALRLKTSQTTAASVNPNSRYSPAVQKYFAAIRRNSVARNPWAPYSPAELQYFAALRRKTSQTTTPSTTHPVPFIQHARGYPRS
jgi:hypothetical protein